MNRPCNTKKGMMNLSPKDFKRWLIEERDTLKFYIDNLDDDADAFEKWYLTEWDLRTFNDLIDKDGCTPKYSGPSYIPLVNKPYLNGIMLHPGEYHLEEGGAKLPNDSWYYNIFPKLDKTSGYLKASWKDGSDRPILEWMDISGLTDAAIYNPTTKILYYDAGRTPINELANFYNKNQTNSAIQKETNDRKREDLVIQNAIVNINRNKQNKLIPGTGISITSDNIISAEIPETEVSFAKITGSPYDCQPLNTELISKQNKEDPTLQTTDQTIVGAINEVNAKVSGKIVAYTIDVETAGNEAFNTTDYSITATSFIDVDGITHTTSSIEKATTVVVLNEGIPSRTYIGNDTFLRVSSAPDLTNYYSKTESDAKYATIDSLNDYYTKKDITDNYYTKTDTENAFATKAALSQEITDRNIEDSKLSQSITEINANLQTQINDINTKIGNVEETLERLNEGEGI